jgi:hypothetical protein
VLLNVSVDKKDDLDPIGALSPLVQYALCRKERVIRKSNNGDFLMRTIRTEAN